MRSLVQQLLDGGARPSDPDDLRALLRLCGATSLAGVEVAGLLLDAAGIAGAGSPPGATIATTMTVAPPPLAPADGQGSGDKAAAGEAHAEAACVKENPGAKRGLCAWVFLFLFCFVLFSP